MGSGGILWVSLGPWEDPIGSGRTLCGSTGLWKDVWVPYRVWEDPNESNVALERLYGSHKIIGEIL